MMPSSERLVSNTRCVAELLLQSFGDEVHAAFAADVLAEDEHLGIHLELVPQRAPHRLGETHDVAVFVRRRRFRRAAARSARERPPNASGEPGVSSA